MAALSGKLSRTTDRAAARTLAARTRLSVVIVNFCQWNNSRRLIRRLLRSRAAAERTADVVLVDNASGGASGLPARPGLAIIRNPSNRGFACGVNRGVQAAAGDWLLLLNPDITLDDDFTDRVLELTDQLPRSSRIGVIGFQLRNPDGTLQASTGQYPTLAGTLLGMLRPRAIRKCGRMPLTHRAQVDWATGGCLLIRRDCFQKLGGFDERYFLYYEDVDFCRRAAAAGWDVVFDPNLHVTHHWPLHRRPVPPALRLITRHALLTYARSHWSGVGFRLLTSLVALEATVRGVAARCRRDTRAAESYRDLGRLARVFRADQPRGVRELIDRAAANLRFVAAAQDDAHAE